MLALMNDTADAVAVAVATAASAGVVSRLLVCCVGHRWSMLTLNAFLEGDGSDLKEREEELTMSTGPWLTRSTLPSQAQPGPAQPRQTLTSPLAE